METLWHLCNEGANVNSVRKEVFGNGKTVPKSKRQVVTNQTIINMFTRSPVLLRWNFARGRKQLPWQRIATVAIALAAFFLALRADEFMIWQLAKSMALA